MWESLEALELWAVVLYLIGVFFVALIIARLSRKTRREEITAHIEFKGYRVEHQRYSASLYAKLQYNGKKYVASLGEPEGQLNKEKDPYKGINGSRKIIVTYYTTIFAKEYVGSVRLVEDDVAFEAEGLPSVGFGW